MSILVTVVPWLELRVSCSIREEFENGRDHYGSSVRLPLPPAPPPSAETASGTATRCSVDER